jgi:indolepyruvate decarboxylase
MKLHAFLFDALQRAGVRHIFGIPGDFALNLYEALERDGRFSLVRLSHEPAVGFAADGASRASGVPGVCCVTYGAGGLNMVNAVACAYAEESPVVVISGGPGRHEKKAAIPVHHEVKTFESQLNVYREVTEYAAILDDPATAASQILHALDVADKVKRPVYLEVPRDMVFEEIAEPGAPLALALKTDEGAVAEAAAEIVDRITAAARPVLIVGVEVHRFQLRSEVRALAERLTIPVASSFLGRGVFPTQHPQFVGTYLGVASPQALRDIVEDSDAVLLLGEQISDSSLGVSANRLSEKNLMIATARDVYIRHHRYQHTPLDRLIAQLSTVERWPARHLRAPLVRTPAIRAFDWDAPIAMLDVIAILDAFFAAHPDMPLVADTGDALFASVDIQSNDIMAPAYYATMGFSIPGALGLEIVTGRRPLVLVGDGAFQMTGPEISHAPAHGCRPIIVLLNNGRWEMLQAFFPHARYNETVSWPFAKLAELWGGRGFDVTTAAELDAALTAALGESRFSLIEVRVRPGDISPVLQRFTAAFKQRVYEPS